MIRSTGIKRLSMGTTGNRTFGLSKLAKALEDIKPVDHRMPVLFCGHGSPMNAIEDNAFTGALRKLADDIPRPKAILCISAHWLTRGTYVNISPSPRMIYDMYGFPGELYEVTYPAPGAPEIAKEVQNLVTRTTVGADTEWGYDHGNWAIMKRLYPDADIPLFQMSIDYYKPAQYHYELAKELAALRKKGVLIIGSGNITHNLRIFDMSDINARPLDWAEEFDTLVKNSLVSGNHKELIDYSKYGRSAQWAVPEPSHYYPLLYSIALQHKSDMITFPYEGFHYASVSMRCVRIG